MVDVILRGVSLIGPDLTAGESHIQDNRLPNSVK